MADGTVSPLSDRTAAGSYTVHPNGREVCFLDSGIVWAVDVETLAERPLLDTRGAITGDDVRFSSSFTADGHYTLLSSNTEGIGTVPICPKDASRRYTPCPPAVRTRC